MQAGANVNMLTNRQTPLLSAILTSRYNALETLLKLGANPDNACGEYAIKMTDLKSLLLLVQYSRLNCDIKEVVGAVSLSLCLHTNDPKVAKVAIDLIMKLISHGYDANEFWDPVARLVRYKSVAAQEMVRFLLFRGANPNHIIRHGATETPLFWFSVDSPNKQIVKILIESGADINQKITRHINNSPRSLLSYACEKIGRKATAAGKEVIEFLLEKGATIS